MSTSLRLSALAASFVFVSQASAFDFLNDSDLVLQLGGYLGGVGQSQYIDVAAMPPIHVDVNKGRRSTAMLGLGYYLHGVKSETFTLDYGLSTFYLFPLKVQGHVIESTGTEVQEFSYFVGNLPIYLAAKANFLSPKKTSAFTMDVGIGPNFMSTYSYETTNLVPGVVPYTDAFEGTTTTSFSAMGGVGFRLYKLFGPVDFEAGYRFFYLGTGKMLADNPIIQDDLQTGDMIANAIVFSILL